MIDLTSEKLCDSLKIDFLTMTVHTIEPKKFLDILCKHSSLDFGKFNIVNRGSLPGYNYSYRFMDQSIITLNWHDERPNFGVCLNVTGRGCQFLDSDFLQKIYQDLKDYTHRVTRLDIALDDFSKKYIDTCKFSEVLRKFQLNSNDIATNVNRRSVQFHIVNDGFGNIAENIEFGNRGSSFMFRLYDKKIEQKRSDISYWKRLEIQLRKKRSDLVYRQIAEENKTINEVFSSQMYSCFKPLDEKTAHWSESSKGNREVASWYKMFLDSISKLYRKCIF